MNKLKSIKLFAVIICALLLSLSLTAQGFEPDEPRQIVLTWQDDPSTTMTITWRTDVEGDDSFLLLSSTRSPADGNYELVEAETYTFDETAAWLHTVELKDLTPGTTYWVTLQTDGKRSDEFCFRTAPDTPDDITFVIGADAQHVRTQMHIIMEVFRRIAEDDPDFFVYSGDFVNAELSDYEWDLIFDAFHTTLITDQSRRIPIVPAIGNHEVVAGYGGTKDLAVFYYNRFRIPEPQTYHVLRYGPDLTIISLDSNHTSPIDGEQALWLERTLEENQDSRWTVAHYHDGSWWGTERMNVKIRANWVPLFEKYGVDLAHSGHSHTYFTSFPIYGLGNFSNKLELIIEESLERAKEDFEPGKNYAPPLQKNLIQLTRGNWEALGYDTLLDAFADMTYMLSLYVIQTGEPSRERVYDQIGTTQLFMDYWTPILRADSLDELIDFEKGVVYAVGGGLGAELGSARDPDRYWWIKEARAAHHYRRVTITSSGDEFMIIPVFYNVDDGSWEEGEAFIKSY